jgi:GxxExxY protein
MALISDPLVQSVIGCAIAVHRVLGPGLFESVYETCVAAEFEATGLSYARQVPIPLVYRDRTLPCVYRMDLVVEGRLVVELKTVDRMLPVHNAQMLTYLKLSGLRQGLLMNFNVPRLVDGIKSFVR